MEVPSRLLGPGRIQVLQLRVLLMDGALALLLAATTVGANLDPDLLPSDAVAPSTPLEWLVALGPTLCVAFRRVAPVPATVAAAAAQMVQWALLTPDFYLATAVMLYSAAAHGGRLGRWAAWVASAAVTAFATLGYLLDQAPLYALPLVALSSVAAAALGQGAASRAAYVGAVEARAAEAERTRATERDRALTEERNRVARELHDVVAHGLSIVVVQAAAAQRILDRDPEGARGALAQIEQTGRNALKEMRHVLSVVRTDPAESWRPAQGLAGLDDLVAELARTGLEVEVERAGGGGEVGPLPATVDMTAYRIVQESLTNVLKHGGQGARARVDISRTPRSLELTIVDDGLGAVAADQGGHGLRGMRERVEVFGGRFRAGPAPGGGFAVEVSLPTEGADAR